MPDQAAAKHVGTNGVRGDVVDEDPAAPEEARRPQDGEAQAAAAHEVFDDGLAGEVRQVRVPARVGDGGPDEPFDPGPYYRLDEDGRLFDGLQVGQPGPRCPMRGRSCRLQKFDPSTRQPFKSVARRSMSRV